MQFSNITTKSGIVEQTRDMMRVDDTQWSAQKIANSCNNWLDKIFTFGKKNDVNFQLDDSNHPRLPIGSTDLVANQSDYSFLVDQDGNRITNITRIDLLDSQGHSNQLTKIDIKDIEGGLGAYQSTAGQPQEYDLIADNIVRLYPKPAIGVVGGLIYYFQRTPSYFTGTDTTKEAGVANDLHRGFVIASAYDGALALGLSNLQALSVELQKEEGKLAQYFASRNTDSLKRMIPSGNRNYYSASGRL